VISGCQPGKRTLSSSRCNTASVRGRYAPGPTMKRSTRKRPRGAMELAKLTHRHLAITTVNASVAWGMLQKGQIQRVRQFLLSLNIEQFSHPKRFLPSLDRATKSLDRHLGGCRWGAARKFLNIFLRNITYNFCLRRKYRLGRVEALLEIPLDSFASKGLRGEREGKSLPRWVGVIHLKPETSAKYQAVASQVAARKNMRRVHLDLLFFRREKGPASQHS
jgi:hypothetical protein